jgi:uncharacterized FlaG/YvyC family protein
LDVNAINPPTTSASVATGSSHVSGDGNGMVPSNANSNDLNPMDSLKFYPVNETFLRNQIDHMNKAAKALETHAQFSFDKEAGRVVVKVIDDQTGEVLKQIPPQDFLDLVTEIRKFVGMFLDKKV